jgi:hypothetical protein
MDDRPCSPMVFLSETAPRKFHDKTAFHCRVRRGRLPRRDGLRHAHPQIFVYAGPDAALAISLGITGHGQNVPFTRFFLPAKACAGFATSRSSPSTRSPERRVILSLYASRVRPQGAGDKRNYSPVSACFLDNSNHDIGCELSPGQSASKLARAASSSRFWRAVASATHAHELFATIS